MQTLSTFIMGVNCAFEEHTGCCDDRCRQRDQNEPLCPSYWPWWPVRSDTDKPFASVIHADMSVYNWRFRHLSVSCVIWPFFSVIRGEITCNTLRCRCITDDADTLPCVVPSDSFILVIHRGEATWNTFCTPCASHHSKSTPSRPYHTLETQKDGSAVESTSYNNGWP